jgi:outer membrane receptor protein involved in Fe transport
LFSVVAVLIAALPAAGEPARQRFDLPAGTAVVMLKRAAQQAGLEIAYSAATVQGVQTRPVAGEFTPREALERMVAATPLKIFSDPQTGALSVLRTSDSTPHANPAEKNVPSLMTPRILLTAVVAWLAASAAAEAQTVSPPPKENAVVLSPFQVNTSRDAGYVASSTLAGTRLNSEIWDTPAAISVFTSEFLSDIGILDVKSSLNFALNASEDTSNYTGNNLVANDVNIQIRGFIDAAVGRNYFTWRLSSDVFNVERIDFSRGPNSVLFGVGAPGGIVNTSSKRALIGQDSALLRTRIGSWEDHRVEYDFSKTLLEDKLAVRANLLWHDKNDWREFKTSERRAGALAATYRPFKSTELRLDSEYGDVDQIHAQPYPAREGFIGWESAGRLVSSTYGQAVSGTTTNTRPTVIWDPFSGGAPVSWNGSRIANVGPRASALANIGASVLDESKLPRWSAITSPGWTNDFHYFNYAGFLEQRLGENFSIEAAFNRQHESRFQNRPTGFAEIVMRVDPNAVRPVASNALGVVTATEPNPNVGRYYIEGANNGLLIADRTIDDYRLTASYRLDLTSRHRWLGRHDLASLVSRTNTFNRDDTLDNRNVTPVGNATFPLDITNGNNQVIRRTYLDFSKSDPRGHGLADPNRYRLSGQGGINEGMVRVGDTGRDFLARADTSMLASQSRWFDGRVVVTAGLRRDRLRVWTDTIDTDNDGDFNEHRAAVTRLFPRRQQNGQKAFNQGDTKTLGTVLHPLSWLAVFYNQSNSFRPQTDQDINGALIGNRKGEGRDYGLRFRLWDNKVNASIARYTTDDANAAVSYDNNFNNFMNSIWRAIGQSNLQRGAASDSQDLSGKGTEVEITANPTSSWRIAINGAQTNQVASSLYPRNGIYLESNRARWMQNANTLLGSEIVVGIPNPDPVTGGPATVLTALREVDTIYRAITAGAGSTRRQLREYTGNFFTAYSFRSREGIIRGLTVGGGANYRGKGVVGFDTTRTNAIIYGPAYTLANAMIAYEWRLKKSRTIKVQLNVDNLLDESRPILTDASQTQEFSYVFQTPRRFGLTTTVNF